MDVPVFERVKEWLNTYFSGKNPAFTPPSWKVHSLSTKQPAL
jgi:hypothetical protein